MFSLIVAFTLYLTLSSAQPGAAAADYVRPVLQEAFLPLAREARATINVPAGPPVPHIRRATKKDQSRLGVDVGAVTAVALDWRTGEELYGKMPDSLRPIASITKLVTALVVLDAEPEWTKEVEVLGSDMRPGGIPYVIPGERMTVENLFNVSLVASGNGATVALARSTGMTDEEFVFRMNRMAERLGMTDALFVEPTGLDARNVASARGVALLVREALSHQEIAEAVRRSEYSFRALSGLDHRVRSTDDLLGNFFMEEPFGFLGGKTGYVVEAGYCFGAAAENATKDKVIAVALGSESREARFDDVKRILYWVFDAYEWN